MGMEIERKFLVDEARLRPLLSGGEALRQGYLADNESMAVRVRIAGDKAWLTIKGAGRAHASGAVARAEFEYAIPREDADQMLDQLVQGACVSKTRYRIANAGYVWEVDVFEGANQGLIVAEVEMESAQSEPPLPAWVAEEVSADPRYLNVNLAKCPFSQW